MCVGEQSPSVPPVEYKFIGGKDDPRVSVHSSTASLEANNFMSLIGTKVLRSMPMSRRHPAFREMYRIALMACLSSYVAYGVIVTRGGFGVRLDITRLLEVWHG